MKTMRPFPFLLLTVFFCLACDRKTDPGAGPTTTAPTSASSGPASSASAPPAAAASSTSGSKIAYAKYTDMNGRFSFEYPESFKIEEQAGCESQTECLPRVIIQSPDKEITIKASVMPSESSAIIGPPAKRLADAVTAEGKRGQTVTAKKELPRGYYLTSTSPAAAGKGEGHYFLQEEMTRSGPMRWDLSAPLARKAEVEPIIGHISETLKVDPASGKSVACRALTWKDGEIADKTASFEGIVGESDGQNGRAENEHFFTLVLLPPFKPICANGSEAPVRELHIYADKSVDLKKHVGQKVTIEGGPFRMGTAHHHRPIVVDVAKITAAK